MDKYKQAAVKKLTNKVHPDLLAKEALVRAIVLMISCERGFSKSEFSSREREVFFDNVYGELLVEYFINWLKTDPHENKTREFIYNSALSLGDVKNKMIQYETYGANVPHLDLPEEDSTI